MKLMLINPGYYQMLQIGLGSAYIASYVRKYGKHEPLIVDENSGDKIEKKARDFKPDLIGITSSTPLFPDALKAAKTCRELFPETSIILGGIHVTALPELTLKQTSLFDAGVIGEGEATALELCNLIDKKGSLHEDDLLQVKGIAFKNKRGEVIQTPRRPFIQDLDSIPFPARDLLNMKKFYTQPRAVIRGVLKKTTQIMSSRGCPYDCEFCASAVMWHRQFRFFSPEYVVAEIKELVEKYDVTALYFVDDTFTVNRERTKKICEMLVDEGLTKNLVWSCQLRANLVDEEIARTIKEGGCIQAEFGFESGNQRVLTQIKGPNVTVEQNYNAAEICKKAGLRVLGNFVVGNPGEKREEILDTFRLMRSPNMDFVHPHIATPYPGSRYWAYANQKGLINEASIDWQKFQMSQITDNIVLDDAMPKEELFKLYEEMSNYATKHNKEHLFVGDLTDFMNLETIKRVIRKPSHLIRYGPKIVKRLIKK